MERNFKELNKNEQLKLFTSEYIIELLNKKDLPYTFLLDLDNENVNKLIIYPKFLELLLSYSVDQLYGLLKNGFIIPTYLYNNYKLINKIVTAETNKYREFVNLLMENNINFLAIIENNRTQYVNNKISSINTEGIFNDITEINEDLFNILPKENVKQIRYALAKDDKALIQRELRWYTEKCLFEFIIDVYFKDITYNFISNLKTMLMYIKNINENIISEKSYELYKKILGFHNLDLASKKRLYYEYNDNVDYARKFYEDFHKCKIHSYKKINESLTSFNKNSSLYSKKLSEEKGIDVYNLEDADFYLYVHATQIKYEDKELVFPFKRNNSVKTISFSLIGKKNIGVYNAYENMIVLGFNELNVDNIIHLYNSDSYTKHQSGSNKVQKIFTPSGLLENTYGYNEILYNRKDGEELFPSFIVCFNEIRNIELYFAKKEKLPIVLIKTLNCRRSGELEDMLENNYKNSESARDIRTYKMM